MLCQNITTMYTRWMRPKVECNALGSTDADDIKKAFLFLYKANKRIYSIITIDQDSDHGFATMQKTIKSV